MFGNPSESIGMCPFRDASVVQAKPLKSNRRKVQIVFSVLLLVIRGLALAIGLLVEKGDSGNTGEDISIHFTERIRSPLPILSPALQTGCT